MNHHEDRRVTGSRPLVVATVVERDAGEATRRDVCTICGGPARLCGGNRCCTGGPTSALGRRWLTAIRAVYAGLVLTRTPAALWGGALLRFARQLAIGALASGSPPPSIARLAAKHADPCGAVPGSVVAGLALAYLQHGDLERLSELSRSLRDPRAPWLVGLGTLGPRAALTTPLEREAFALFAVRCDKCASNPALSLDQLYEDVATYDAAIRCSRCKALSKHPLPGVKIGEPHPVGRCLPGAGEAARACRVHDGHELDVEGLCVEGRATFNRAVLEVAKIGRATTPFECDLVQALLRSRERSVSAVNAWIDDDAVARGLVTSPKLMPFFAALAASDPEAARDLAQIAGAPLDTNAADPSVLAAMSGQASLAGMIANGKAVLASGWAAFVSVKESLSPKLPVPAPTPSRPVRKLTRGKPRHR